MANPMNDGEVRYVQGSAAKPYQIKFIGGVYSCSCAAWRNQSKKIDERSCKHLRAQGVTQGTLAPKVSPDCACHKGSTCDISHDPATCTCNQCTTAEQKSTRNALNQVNGAKPPDQTVRTQEDPVPLKDVAISPRVNRFGGFVPFSDQEKATIVAAKEAQLGRKLRQDEKTGLFGPPVLLANTVEDDFDPTGWWVSIKKDGLRAYWNGEVFVSRGGNIYSAPSWFTLPQVPLDGELYLGRDMLEETNSIVRSSTASDGWKKITFVVFDAPVHNGTFEQRLAMLQSLAVPAHVEILAQHKCISRAEFDTELDQVTAANEEGLMLRKPGSTYEGRRSSTLLKAKKFSDIEVMVIGHEKGKGKHKGKLGGLVVQMDDGKMFNVGTGLTDRERANPPPIGCRVTVSFTSWTRYGIPKCAAFVAVRVE